MLQQRQSRLAAGASVYVQSHFRPFRPSLTFNAQGKSYSIMPIAEKNFERVQDLLFETTIKPAFHIVRIHVRVS